MVDLWQDRIPLNPRLSPSKDAGTSIPGATQGTVGGGINQSEPSDSASSVDISNNVTEKPAPAYEPGKWGGIVNQFD